jgi:hypothetical protein
VIATVRRVSALEDWPDDEAKYETFGGSEAGESTYDERHEEALGEHSVWNDEGDSGDD